MSDQPINGHGVQVVRDAEPTTAFAAAFANAKKQDKEGRPVMNNMTKDAAHMASAVVHSPAATPAAPARRSPAEILAEVRTKRLSALAMKVEVDPQIAETIAALREEQGGLEAIKVEATGNLTILRSSLGDKDVDQKMLKNQVHQQEQLLADMDTALADVDTALATISTEGGVGLTLALIARLKLGREVNTLLENFEKGPLTATTITNLVGKAAEMNLVMIGSGEVSFRWSRDHFVSAVAGDPSALGFVPRAQGYIAEFEENKAARVKAAGEKFLDDEELKAFAASRTRTSLSALLAGTEGYTLVPVQGLHDKVMGQLVVEGDGNVAQITHVTRNVILVGWALTNQRGKMAERPVKFRRDGSFDHPHGAVQKAFEAVWEQEAPIRATIEAGKATEAELAAFAAEHNGEKIHTLSLASISTLLKDTTAGQGLWLVEGTWQDPNHKNDPRAPFGLVIEKRGKGKIEVVMTTSTAPATISGEKLAGSFSVTNMPRNLKAAIRSACHKLGMREGFPPEIQKDGAAGRADHHPDHCVGRGDRHSV